MYNGFQVSNAVYSCTVDVVVVAVAVVTVVVAFHCFYCAPRGGLGGGSRRRQKCDIWQHLSRSIILSVQLSAAAAKMLLSLLLVPKLLDGLLLLRHRPQFFRKQKTSSLPTTYIERERNVECPVCVSLSFNGMKSRPTLQTQKREATAGLLGEWLVLLRA